jgi:hypothetical protein
VFVSDPVQIRRLSRSSACFALYVEGPSDLDILQVWARRLSPALARVVQHCGVILGGRQPARALEHFRELQLGPGEMRGVCVLDRDEQTPVQGVLSSSDARLEFFTWPRRHIESYLLVPAAIRRCLGLHPDDPRVARLLQRHIPDEGNEAGLAEIDAKRLLASRGPIARELGLTLSPAGIARCMRDEELHSDVISLFQRVREGVGL